MKKIKVIEPVKRLKYEVGYGRDYSLEGYSIDVKDRYIIDKLNELVTVVNKLIEKK